MTELLVGTSGYQYKAWKGSFYPEDMRPEQMLSYYAERFPAVEINNTFYRMPRESVVAGWASQVPDGFRFVLKASQRITHRHRLANADEAVSWYLEACSGLGGKRGASFFQCPPNLKKDAERLRAFLALLPDGWPAAFEFRHPSWFDGEIYDALRERNAALCLADTDDGEPPREATADWGYLRLRRDAYDAAALVAWRSWIAEQDWSHAYVFFKHEDAGAGPALASAFLETEPSS